MSKYKPISKLSAYSPLAPSVTANAVPAPSRRELWGAYLFTLACTFGKVPAVEYLGHGEGRWGGTWFALLV